MRLNLKLNNIKNKIKAFTLAEILIVLSVIAIITAILLPAARNAMPNEDIVKFKKAHNTLYSAIRELVNSDKYYPDGDLSVKPDGSNAGQQYNCNALSDILTTKKVVCARSDSATIGGTQYRTLEEKEEYIAKLDKFCTTGRAMNLYYNPSTGVFDKTTNAANMLSTLILSDNVTYGIFGVWAKDGGPEEDYFDDLGFDARVVIFAWI